MSVIYLYTTNILHIMDDYDEIGEEPWHKGPIRIIMGLFLAILIISMVVPFYSIKTNPEPKGIPTIDEIFPEGIEGDIGNVSILNSKNEYYTLIYQNDPVVKYAADRIVTESCRDFNKICYVKAIFYFTRDNFQYVNDPTSFEYVKTARQSLMSRGGDCDDASVLMVSLLKAVGIQSRFVFEPGHVYIQAMVPDALDRYKTEGNWVNLDGTCRYCEFGEISISSIDKTKNIV